VRLSTALPIDVHFLDYSDKEINELGARGIGEIGLAGVAAAISDAIHHATGVRSWKVLVVAAIELMAEKGRMRLPDLVLTTSEAMGGPVFLRGRGCLRARPDGAPDGSYTVAPRSSERGSVFIPGRA
jgi:hypothetical protein